MLRSTTAFATLLAASSALAQQPPGTPQPGAPQRPAQTTDINGTNQNQARDRNAPAQTNPPGNIVSPTAQNAPPRNDVPDRNPQGQNAQGNRNQARRGGAGQSMDARFDSHVADCLILGNQEEIALLKFGMERTKNDKIRELAKNMIKDHEEAITKLREHGSRQNANVELTAAEAPQTDGGRTREALKVADDEAGSAQAGQNNMPARMHRMARIAHEKSLILNREELGKYKDDEFDQAFLGQQLGAHIGMLAKLKAAQEETSSELSELTLKAQETTKKHKDHLEKMMNEISQKDRGDK